MNDTAIEALYQPPLEHVLLQSALGSAPVCIYEMHAQAPHYKGGTNEAGTRLLEQLRCKGRACPFTSRMLTGS